ncbi:retrotransposon protein, putative, ty1-copia subclass, partial [Tanacetum coccineum]
GLRASRKLKPGTLSMYVGNGQREAVEAIGVFYLCLLSGLEIVLNNCHYAPSITRGVIFVSCLYEDGFINRFVNNTIQVSRNNIVYFSVIPRNGIFEIDLSNSYANESSIYTVSNKRAKLDLDSALLWHCRLGHISKKCIEKLHNGCVLDTPTFEYLLYGSVVISKIFENECVFQKEVRNQLVKKTIKSLRSDRGSEYMSQEFLDHLKDHGIIAHRTPPYTPQHNVLLGFALETAACILNMVPTKKVEKTPYEQVGVLEAKTLSKIVSQKPKSIDKGRRYKRRKETKGKKVVTSLDFQEEVSAGYAIGVNTGSIKVSTISEQVSTASGQVSTDKEEELNEQQKQRRAQVQFEAQHYTDEDWDLIRAKIEANAELSKSVLGSGLQGEDFAKKMVELVNQRKKHFAEERARAKRNKPITQSQLRTYMMNYLKNQGTWKLSQLKNLSFEEVKEEFDKLVKQVESFAPINFEATKDSLKRFGEELQTKTSKRLKSDEAKDDESTKKTGKRRKQIARKGLHSDKTDEDESEASKDADPISGTNIPINPVPVAIKPPSIATYKIIKQGKKSVYQIVRENGTDIVYINFGAMLKDITRDDLTELYRIVMNRYGMNGPEDELEKSSDIYMLTERKYPLTAEVCKAMLDKKLQGGKPDEDCYKLLKMMEKQAGIRKHKDWLVQEQTALGKDFSNPLMADNLPKIVWLSTHHIWLVKSWLAHKFMDCGAKGLTSPEQTATVAKVDGVSLVDGVFDGAFGGDGDEDFVIGKSVVVPSSSLVKSTKSCLGGMIERIFKKRTKRKPKTNKSKHEMEKTKSKGLALNRTKLSSDDKHVSDGQDQRNPLVD